MTYKIPRMVLLLLMTVCFQSTALSQELIKCEKLNISFETNQVLNKYEESTSEMGYENEDIAIDIERKYWYKLPMDQEDGVKSNAEDVTRNLGFKDFKPGGKIPNIDQSYYYIANDKWGNLSFPVYVLFAVSPKKDCVYEITVYCYNNDIEEGKKLIESIKLLD